MRNKKIYLIAIITLIFILIFLINLESTEKKIVPVKVIVSNTTGFDFEYDGLSFGKLQINQSASRDIKIENINDKKEKIVIKSSGEISKNLIVSENNFYLNPGESKNLTFSFFTEGLSEFKEYRGEIIIITRRFLI